MRSARSCAVAPSARSAGAGHRLASDTGGGSILAGASGQVTHPLHSSSSEAAIGQVLGVMAKLRDGGDDEAVTGFGLHDVAQFCGALQVPVAGRLFVDGLLQRELVGDCVRALIARTL